MVAIELVPELWKRLKFMVEPGKTDRSSSDGDLFRLFIESFEDCAYYAVDMDGKVCRWSRGAERLLGYRDSEIIGESANQFFAPDYIGNDLPRLDVEEPPTFGQVDDERRLIRKDRTRFLAKRVVTVLLDDGGDAAGFGVFVKDRDDRAEGERERLEGEARRRAILDTALDCVITIDGEGKVLEFNQTAERTFGYSRTDVIGREMSGLIIPPQLREAHRRGLARYLATGEGPVLGKRIEITAMRSDGSEFPVELAITAIPMGGRPLFTAYLRDIQERKRAEAATLEQTRLFAFGRDIGLTLVENVPLAEMLARAAETTVRHLDGAFARIWTLNESGDTLELKASAGLYTHLDGPHSRVTVGEFKIGRIAKECRPHLTNSVVGDPLVPAQDWARREGMVAFAGYPLVVEDRLIGVWAMFARHPLSELTLDAMATVANGIALGIERKRAEVALAKSESRLATTLSSIGDAVITTDGFGRVQFMNPIAEALTGWSKTEASDRPMEEVFRIVNEHTRQPVEHPVARVIREGVIVGLANHTVLIARDGTETPIEDSAAPIKDEQGQVAGVVMVFRDVTEERSIQQAVAESEERYRTLVEVSPQTVWAGRPDGSITFANRWWLDYTGLSMEETSGSGWTRAIHPEHVERVRQDWSEALSRSESFETEIPFRRGADGVYHWHFARGMPVKDEAGRVVKWIGIAIDVDDRKRADEERRIARDEAEQANKAKDQFLAVLSHELRTPLNPILLAASSMLDSPTSPDDFRPTMEMIRHNVNLQARLIDDLLDVMRIVQGKMPLHWGVADCHVLIDHAVQVCQSEVFGKAIGLSLDLGASHPHINADSARLEQVFWNLIKNAVKFSPEGGRLVIRTRNEGESGEDLVIEVSDTGIGIEQAMLSRVFDPFQQGEQSITRKFGGLGLGLAICRGVIEAHGGTIVAQSQGKEQGTTFRIVLTALPTAATEGQARPKDSATVAETFEPSVVPLKILVVEDEEATRRLLAKLLRGLGNHVTTAGSIAEAMQAGDYNLIISDIGLPDGTGLDLMRQVVSRRGPIPAIALTGYGMEEDIQRSREAGFIAHMTKPIDFTKLRAMIRQVVPTQP